MQVLPITQYDKVAKAFNSKHITSSSLQAQLKASQNYIKLNGSRLKVSANLLISKLAKLEGTNPTLARIRTEVKSNRISLSTLETEYNILKDQNYI